MKNWFKNFYFINKKFFIIKNLLIFLFILTLKINLNELDEQEG